MASGIIIDQRIIVDISIPVETLRIPRIGHNRIRLDKPSQRRVVPSSAIVVESQPRFCALARVFVTGQRLAAAVAFRAPSTKLRASAGAVAHFAAADSGSLLVVS